MLKLFTAIRAIVMQNIDQDNSFMPYYSKKLVKYVLFDKNSEYMVCNSCVTSNPMIKVLYFFNLYMVFVLRWG